MISTPSRGTNLPRPNITTSRILQMQLPTRDLDTKMARMPSDDEHELSILRGTGDLISVSSSNKPPKRNQKLKETPSVPTSEQCNKFSVDPFGLLQYGGLSQSQFAPGGGQEHLEDAHPVFKDGSPFDDVGIMPEAAIGLAEYISQSTQPEDSWQSFMQAFGHRRYAFNVVSSLCGSYSLVLRKFIRKLIAFYFSF